ncbi:hypothetical protein [Kineosporia babensis]|uniref:Uncharacterized protein n=1 Tax=Kineosporia babensis TaxID=499548 RepID=A0A9X1SXE0_9ACTN|nr:hypothetical protein [Kineosporia babensis]MCD5316122.1 hypothetical protein [Kineosporia babensis]
MKRFRRRPAARESGQGSIFLIALVGLAFLFTAFFVDVSRSLNAHGTSLEVAAEAARAAADQITQESLRSGDPSALQIDAAAAAQVGQAWLTEAGATGEVRVQEGNTVVVVTARVPCQATLLSAFGFTDLSKLATASATVLYGSAGSVGEPIVHRSGSGPAAGAGTREQA